MSGFHISFEIGRRGSHWRAQGVKFKIDNKIHSGGGHRETPYLRPLGSLVPSTDHSIFAVAYAPQHHFSLFSQDI